MYALLSSVPASGWQPVIDAIMGAISVSTVVSVLAAAVTGGIGLVFMWWAVRKTAKVLMSAFRKGKLSV